MKKFATRHNRGLSGQSLLVMFPGFQALMIGSVILDFTAAGDVVNAAAGAVIGRDPVAAFGCFVWMPGTVILGTAVLSVRGKPVTCEVDA